ncbi:hypothetical protein [Actinophytocola sp.]|uniref:hypothetical protein n=1 Tax=Actinophytocola sp. TaxID=1872138 RepID=UPI002ED3B2C2
MTSTAPQTVETIETVESRESLRGRPLPLTSAELASLRATSDRSDPLDEAVLCVVEAAVLAVDAARRARSSAGSVDVHSHLRAVLAAARAAVTAANFAVIEAKDAEACARTSRPS